ncbi:hypothetical protein [Methanobrevibacter sp.]|uniref:hypothetical protein n=1 Tax=Methanobrevibacter sp. TaxID=66852 RepID=UPI0025F77D75|nr:hypothetical protein [Methanobrevibacter sp.]MBR4448159.1 hypothetical protein [Methanobrevibacter sp.]
MNSSDFISELVSQTGLTQEQGVAANDVFESTFLAGNKNKNIIVSQLVQRLGVDEAQAEIIYNVGIGLLSAGIISKIKGMIFRR